MVEAEEVERQRLEAEQAERLQATTYDTQGRMGQVPGIGAWLRLEAEEAERLRQEQGFSAVAFYPSPGEVAAFGPVVSISPLKGFPEVVPQVCTSQLVK